MWGEASCINITNFFRVDFFVCFSGFASYPLKCKKFFKLGSKKFHFLKFKKFFWASFFHFLSYKSSVSWNIRKLRFLKYMEFFRIFCFPTYKESFLLKKYKKSFQSFHSLIYKSSFLLRKYKKFFNIRVYEIFSGWIFLFFELGLKSAPGNCILYHLNN